MEKVASAAVETGRRQRVIATWAVGAVALMLLEAVYRLGHRALLLMERGLTPLEWAALCANVALFAYVEGYRALQRRFVPKLVTRAFEGGTTLRGCFPVLGAPFHALGLWGAPPRELKRAWLAVALIFAAVLGVRALPEPWRGIMDAGVAAALAWGTVALLRAYCRR